jgi:ArsR family transcriptional regulator
MKQDATDATPDTASNDTGRCCTPPGSIDTDAVAADLQVLSAMANDTRYELLRRVAAADGGVCVCNLESAVGVSQSAVSQALSRLYAAGLVTRRKDGSWRYYEPTETAGVLLDTLDDLRGNDD